MMPKRKAKSLTELYHRVQLTTAPLPASVGIEAFLDELTGALHKSRTLPGLTTSADLLLRRVYVTCTLDHQSTVDEATSTAIGAFRKACRDLPSIDGFYIDIAELLVERLREEDEEDRQALLGTPEVAERLGVSRERVRQWATTPGRFPVPAARTRETNVWRWGDIADWLELGGRRKTGRPKKITADALSAKDMFILFTSTPENAEKAMWIRRLIDLANAHDEMAARYLGRLNKTAARFDERTKTWKPGPAVPAERAKAGFAELTLPARYTRALEEVATSTKSKSA